MKDGRTRLAHKAEHAVDLTSGAITGGMRRTHLRGRDNILKRLLIPAAAFNLALMMRVKYGMGMPRSGNAAQLDLLLAWTLLSALSASCWSDVDAWDNPENGPCNQTAFSS